MDDSTKNLRWRSDRSRADTLSKKDQSKPLKVDTDRVTVNNGYLSDNVIKNSLNVKKKGIRYL